MNITSRDAGTRFRTIGRKPDRENRRNKKTDFFSPGHGYERMALFSFFIIIIVRHEPYARDEHGRGAHFPATVSRQNSPRRSGERKPRPYYKTPSRRECKTRLCRSRAVFAGVFRYCVRLIGRAVRAEKRTATDAAFVSGRSRPGTWMIFDGGIFRVVQKKKTDNRVRLTVRVFTPFVCVCRRTGAISIVPCGRVRVMSSLVAARASSPLTYFHGWPNRRVYLRSVISVVVITWLFADCFVFQSAQIELYDHPLFERFKILSKEEYSPRVL